MSEIRIKMIVGCPAAKSDGRPRTFIGLEDLESGTGRLLTRELPTKAATDSVIHWPGDVLFSKLRPYLAKSYQADARGTATSELLVLRPSAQIESRFLFYLTLSRPWIEWANTTAYGTKMPRTSWELVADYRASLPPIDEQRRISNFLDAETKQIDELSAARSEQLALLAERDKVARDDLLDEVRKDYGTLPLRRITLRIDQGASPQCDNVPKESDEWGVLKLSAVKRGEFLTKENKRLPIELPPDRRFRLNSGDLLVTRANTPQLVGDAAVVSGDAHNLLLPDLIYRIKLVPEWTSRFVMHVILSSAVRGLIEADARGSSQSMVKLRGEDIRAWPVPYAPTEKQGSIVNAIDRQLSAVSEMRSALTEQLALLAERRQALITAAVTGQFDVTTARRAAAA